MADKTTSVRHDAYLQAAPSACHLQVTLPRPDFDRRQPKANSPRTRSSGPALLMDDRGVPGAAADVRLCVDAEARSQVPVHRKPKLAT